MNYKLGRMWKKAVTTYVKHYPVIFPKGASKTTKYPRIGDICVHIRSGYYLL